MLGVAISMQNPSYYDLIADTVHFVARKKIQHLKNCDFSTPFG